ncbi:hypothetical protein [Actinomadura formosensis]|uniref:hypothetical protein n=1 Tax=Actinomadura formosensis TaxID=60706 RepID=UPI000830ABE5|nr:hypothetical protein [Actinomadura formosensis]
MSSSRRRRVLPDVEGARIEHGVGPAREEGAATVSRRAPGTVTAPDSAPALAEVIKPGLDLLPEALGAMVPAPSTPRTSEPRLAADERAAFEHCDKLVRTLDGLFWVRGKALKTISGSDLAREDYSSFEEYAQARLGRSARRAYQLMEVAELGEYLWREVRKIFRTAGINESQTRTLLPLADRHGPEAAALVLTTTLSAGQKPTAELLRAVLAILPDDRFDPDDTTRRIKDFLAEDVRVLPPPDKPDPADTAVQRFRSVLQRTIRQEDLQAVRSKHPDEARQLATELRELAAELDPPSA